MDNEATKHTDATSSESQQGFSTERDFSEFYSAHEPVVDIPAVPQTYDPYFDDQSGFDIDEDDYLDDIDPEMLVEVEERSVESEGISYFDDHLPEIDESFDSISESDPVGVGEPAEHDVSEGNAGHVSRISKDGEGFAFEDCIDALSHSAHKQEGNPRLLVSKDDDSVPKQSRIPEPGVEHAEFIQPHQAYPHRANVQSDPTQHMASQQSHNPHVHQSAVPAYTQHADQANHAAQRSEHVRVQHSDVVDGNPRQSHSPQPAYSQAPILVPTPAPVGRTMAPARKSHSGLKIAFFVIAIIAVLALAFVYLIPWDRDITVDGEQRTVKAHTTLEQIASDMPTKPAPGDLLAIDGTLLQEGQGKPYTFYVNGQEVDDAQYQVRQDDVIDISDGKDAIEDFSEVEIPLGSPVEIDGVGAVHRFDNVGEVGSGIQRTGAISGIVQTEVVQEPTTEVMSRFNVNTNGDKVIALTFDDGPWPNFTEEILNILAENDAKATFFTVGERIDGLKDVVKRASDSGHQICTHTWDHASGSGQGVNLDYMTDDEQRQEVSMGLKAIQDATGQEASKVVRVPGGNLSENTAKILKEFATSEIGWNIDTQDWRRPGTEAIASHIQAATPGDIILMHDGGGDRSQTVEALRQSLPILREQGYRFVTIDELLSTYAS